MAEEGEDLEDLKARVALLEARLVAQQALLEQEARRRIALEEALARHQNGRPQPGPGKGAA